MTALLRPARADPAGRLRAVSSTVIPGVVVLTSGLFLGTLEGGFAPRIWYPAALFMVALLVLVLVLAPPERSERSPVFTAALAAYGAFCLWSFLSILWADVPGDAWDGANRTLLYGLVLAIIGLRPWSRRAGIAALAIVGFGGAAIAGGLLLLSTGMDDPSGLFVEGRLADPSGYSNATADFWLIAFWPALHLSASRLLPWPARGLALASASLLLQIALLSQSRGAAAGFVVTAIVYLALVPRRWPAVLALASVVLLALLGLDPLLDVRESASAAELASTLEEARTTILTGTLVALLAGMGAALLGRQLPQSVLDRRWVVRAGNAALAALALAGVVVTLSVIGSPGAWLDARWEDFKTHGYESVEAEENRFGGSLGSNRYDFYRVALNQFEAHPVRGIGADNFSVPYLQERRSSEAPRYPHSLAFRILAQLGAVGAGLFLLFLGLVLLAVGRALRGATVLERGVIVAALAGFTMWLTHGLADWLWEFPALGIIAFSLLAIAARSGSHGGDRAGDRAGGSPDGAVTEPQELLLLEEDAGPLRRRLVLAALAVLAAISLALPGIAARFTNAAYDQVRKDPETALARLDRAARLNFLSAEPLVAKGVVSQRLGDRSTAREAFRQAIEPEPKNWFAHFELGLVESADGRRDEAARSFRAAAALNPRQPLIRTVAMRNARGGRIEASAVEAQLYNQLKRKLRATDQG